MEMRMRIILGAGMGMIKQFLASPCPVAIPQLVILKSLRR